MEAVLTTFLAPFLSYFLRKGEEVADATVERFGAAAWDHAQALWRRLQPKLETKDAAREAVEDVAAAPDDELARAALQHQLNKLLSDDPDLARELSQLLADGKRAGVMGDNGAVVIGGSVVADRGGVAAGRDINAGQGGIHTGGGPLPDN